MSDDLDNIGGVKLKMGLGWWIPLLFFVKNDK
jgi:hypothetical protein